jgi:hypothetical protein
MSKAVFGLRLKNLKSPRVAHPLIDKTAASAEWFRRPGGGARHNRASALIGLMN